MLDSFEMLYLKDNDAVETHYIDNNKNNNNSIMMMLTIIKQA